MSLHITFPIKVLVYINLLLVLPAILGLYMFSVALFRDNPVFAIGVFSLVLGIANGFHLFFRMERRRAWVYNLVMSVYALIAWLIVFLLFWTELWFTGYWTVFFWPIVMCGVSFRILQNFHRYEKAKR